MMIQGIPTPPPPPVPPLPPIPPIPPDLPAIVQGGSGGPGAAEFMLILAVIVAATLVLWPLMRALARRIEGRSGGADGEVLQELDDLRARVAELEAGQSHMAELENRVDFAERLLAQRAEQSRVVGG
jgi:hypothetical protein